MLWVEGSRPSCSGEIILGILVIRCAQYNISSDGLNGTDSVEESARLLDVLLPSDDPTEGPEHRRVREMGFLSLTTEDTAPSTEQELTNAGYQMGNQIARLKQHFMALCNMTKGRSQGSILGPLLWNILVVNLLCLPMPKDCRKFGYVNDSLVIVSSNSRSALERKAQAIMANVSQKAVVLFRRLRVMSPGDWELNFKTLLGLYKGIHERIMTYGLIVWNKRCAVHLAVIEAYRTVSTNTLQVFARVAPMDLHVAELGLLTMEKVTGILDLESWKFPGRIPYKTGRIDCRPLQMGK
ncbi:hypothetical protein PR048_002768 [Dryococelus australis]|uniref:Reverse transcriptase domain-containing protein n=1 Tax=Dryococelus australis TaxID=614101 RepID=A0ABQ9IL60_9NEOP|nr:hypothetical protein PR048_002768 [Dryococelus australis]